MLRILSIRSRLMFLSLLLVMSLIATNMVLINQARNQNVLIRQQALSMDLIVRADTATQTFGDLKYWLTDLAVSQLVLSEQMAEAARSRFEAQLSDLGNDLPDEIAGVADQVSALAEDSAAAMEAYGRDDRLVGNAMMANGRGHILAIDSKLSALVDGLRTRAQSAAEQAFSRTEGGIRTAIVIVVLVVLVGTALTLLILHSVVVPLQQMIGVIREMSAGNMDVPIPAAGRDEIGQVARVLALFRESVLRRERAEKIEARLREVIENISEGFGLYDADDRLVLSNRRYRERLHHEGLSRSTAALMTPGTPFETIIRATVASGLIRDANGDPETWLAERLARHRHPTGPLVQQRRDDRWIQVNEHRTADDGIVAIYTDITDLKRHEEKLAEKTAILEATLENMDEGISMFDAEHKLIVHNRKFLRLWDYPPERFQNGSGAEEFIRFGAARGEYGPGEVDDVARAARLRAAVRPSGLRAQPAERRCDRDSPLPAGHRRLRHDLYRHHRAQAGRTGAARQPGAAPCHRGTLPGGDLPQGRRGALHLRQQTVRNTA